MKLIHLNVSSMLVNCYIYYDENTLDAVIIDPGADCEKIMANVTENNLKVKAILLTHGHFDHIGAVNDLKEAAGIPVYMHELEEELASSDIYNESLRGLRKSIKVFADISLKDGDIITVGEGKLEVLLTPGHTAGGVCYYDRENLVLFSGDTLFRESVGRSDLYSGNTMALYAGIKRKLYTLPDNVKVFPGHGNPTTIGHEKENNPFVK